MKDVQAEDTVHQTQTVQSQSAGSAGAHGRANMTRNSLSAASTPPPTSRRVSVCRRFTRQTPDFRLQDGCSGQSLVANESLLKSGATVALVDFPQ